MFAGLDILSASALMVLSSAGGVTCTVPEAPQIVITPVTKKIRYDYSKTAKQLGQYRSGTINPYGASVDTTTGGLREDRPKTNLQVEWGVTSYSTGPVCLHYKKIEVTIELAPKIYLAKEYNKKRSKCKSEILEHERRHVEVDRVLINQYAQNIGVAIQNAVRVAGAMGPYNEHEVDAAQKRLFNHVKSAMGSQELNLYEAMKREQAKVDSIQEYERISRICQKEGVGVNRRR